MMDRFVFYSNSAPAPPGKGANEYAAGTYPDLAPYPNFRQVLSNFDASGMFFYRDTPFATIEHAFHAEKAQLCGRSDIVNAIIQGYDIDPAVVKGFTSRKKMPMTPGQVAEWNHISRAVMKDIARAKYAQCEDARKILLATGDAQLIHIISRAKTGENLDHFKHLEELRKEFRGVS